MKRQVIMNYRGAQVMDNLERDAKRLRKECLDALTKLSLANAQREQMRYELTLAIAERDALAAKLEQAAKALELAQAKLTDHHELKNIAWRLEHPYAHCNVCSVEMLQQIAAALAALRSGEAQRKERK